MSFTHKILALMLMLSPSFAYGSGAESFTYQGYITDLAEAPVVSTSVNFTFQILDPTSSCVLYEESQNGVVTDNKGMVSLRVGSPPGDPKRSASPIDGGLTMSSIFVNGALVRGAAANCAGGYTSTFGDVRILRVKVNGSALAPDTVLNAAPRAVVAETLEGIPASGFIQAGGNVTQGNLNSLTGAGDIGGTLHNHDGRYLSLGGAATHDLGTGNSYISGGAGKFGVGITAPNADIDIERSSPVLRIGSTTNAGNNSKLEFYGNNGATNTASIQSKDNANVLNFYTGGVQAMGIDSSQNVIFGASVSVTGTIGLGKYSTAQEGAVGTPGTLLFALNALGAAATGTTWVNSTTNTLRYWDGSAGQSIASSGGGVSTFNGRSGVVTPVANDYTWAQVDKTTSSFADITTRSATDINAGTLADGRLSANIPLKNAANIFSMGGQQINSSAVGEVPLTLKGFAAQTANLLEIKDSANTVLYSIEETGIPSAASDLTNKSYVDTAASTAGGLYIKKDGSVPLTGDWAVGTHKLTGLTDPSSAQDAATKNYVDTQTSNTNYLLKAGGTLAGALSITTADGLNSTNAIATITNNDTTNGQSQGLLIQAGNSTGDFPLKIQKRDTTDILSVKADGNIGIGTTSPSTDLSFGTGANRAIALERASDGLAGKSLTLQSGAAGTAGGNASGGDLVLASGISKGTQSSKILLQVATGGVAGDHGPATAMVITGNNGTYPVNVGIGTASPSSLYMLDIAGSTRMNANLQMNFGQIVEGYYPNAASCNIDWDNGNSQESSCISGYSFSNMKSGGNYTLVVTNGTSATNTFSHGGDSFRFVPANGATSASYHTIYKFLKMGSIVYVKWETGY